MHKSNATVAWADPVPKQQLASNCGLLFKPLLPFTFNMLHVVLLHGPLVYLADPVQVQSASLGACRECMHNSTCFNMVEACVKI